MTRGAELRTYASRQAENADRVEPSRYPTPLLAVTKEDTHSSQVAGFVLGAQGLFHPLGQAPGVAPLSHGETVHGRDVLGGQGAIPVFGRDYPRLCAGEPAPGLQQQTIILFAACLAES